jgi:preprotein translocase SecE subunit
MIQPTVPQKKQFFLFRHISGVINELKKVVWLKWPQEVLYLSGMVLLVTIIFAAVLGTLDFGFSELIGKLFMPG